MVCNINISKNNVNININKNNVKYKCKQTQCYVTNTMLRNININKNNVM